MPTRRAALGIPLSLSGLGLGALAIAAPLPSANSGSPNAVASVPASTIPPGSLLSTFMRLATSLDDRLVIWWMDGICYGVVDAICRPLYGMKVGMFHQFEREPDGTYRFAIFELTYYTELDTGALLTAYANPYRPDRHCDPRQARPTVRAQTSEGVMVPPDPAIREYHGRLGPVTVQGDRIWLRTDVEATDETRAGVPADLSFQNIIRWEPWMRRGHRPGHLMSRAIGRKVATVEELPVDYRAMAEQKHPDYLRDPRGILAHTRVRTTGKPATAG